MTIRTDGWALPQSVAVVTTYVWRTSSQTLMYRIQCDQLYDMLPIPNPQNPSLCIALEFVPIMSNPCGGFVKLVSVHEQDGNNNLGYEVLSL